LKDDVPPSVFSSRLVQEGRSRYQRAAAAEGIEPRHPFAGVVAVAESLPGDERSASLAVSTVRDIFGEGVAYGIGEALADAVEEASERIRDAGLQGCSIAAAAYLDDRVWVAHRGNCRIFRVLRGEAEQVGREHTLAVQMGLEPGTPGFRERSRDLTAHLGERRAAPDTHELVLRPGESVLLLTAGAWLELDSADLATGACGEAALSRLSSRAKLRFRRQGGALASVCYRRAIRWHMGRRRIMGALPFLVPAVVLAGLVYLATQLVTCNGSRPEPAPADTTEVVMPLEPPPPGTAGPADGAILPVEVLVLADDSLALSPDSFTQILAGAPAPDRERAAPGVYLIAGDSLADSLAAVLTGTAADSVFELGRLVAVRSEEVAAFADWLEALDPEEAAETGVLVEAETSVSGGAAWTGRFALFANGDPQRRDEPSSYRGSEAPGIPAIPDSSLYRIVVVPGSLD
jgi:hypothetical protein